jgi:hypothetical protein
MSDIRNEHAPCPPSDAELWLNCGGSYEIIQWGRDHGHLPEDTETIYTMRGTAAHELGNFQVEAMMREKGVTIPPVPADLDPMTLPADQVSHRELLGPDDFEAVNTLLGWVDQERLFGGGEFLMERRVVWSKEIWGSLDYGFVRAERSVVGDYKNGFVYVPETSPQFRIYGAALAKEQGLPPDHEIQTVVIQPKPFGKPPIRSCVYRVGDLYDWMESTVQPWAERILSEESLPREPGEVQCRWCAAKGICPELREWAAKQERLKAQSPAASALTPAQVAEALNGKPLMDIWYEGLSTQALQWSLQGVLVPGFKAVKGITHRKYGVGDSEAEKLLASLTLEDGSKVFKRADYVKPKLLSAAQVASKLKDKPLSKKSAEKVKRLIVKPEGGPVLAMADDSRQAIEPPPVDTLFRPVGPAATAAPGDFKLEPSAAGSPQTNLPL